MASKYAALFEEVLSQNAKSDEKFFIESVSDLTNPGEHFCSSVFKVDYSLENSKENRSKSRKSAVAKVVKIGIHEFLIESSKIVFKKEIAFYTEISPTFRQFQIENGLEPVFDIFPDIVAFRRKLSEDCIDVDENVVLILENLKTIGYENINRNVGFDLEGAKLVLADLAAFHAIPLALKLKKPDIFEDKIKRHCYPVKFPEGLKLRHVCTDTWIDLILNQEKCKPFQDLLKPKLDIELERMDTFFKRPSIEPYATVIHFDMWTNNTMQIMENGKYIKNKFVDFQNFCYASPLCDVVLFIWSSVQLEVIKQHYEELIKHYYQNFVKILKDFDCDLTPFAYDKFIEQLDENAPSELLHILYLVAIIYIDQGENAIDFSKELNEFMNKNISKAAAERIEIVVEEFGNRGWIKY